VITSESFLSKPFSEELKGRTEEPQRTLSRKLFLDLLAFCDVASEFLTCAVVIVMAVMVQSYLCGPPGYPVHKLLTTGVLSGGLAIVLLRGDRRGHGRIRNDIVQETARAIRASIQAVAILFFAHSLLRADLPLRAVAAGFIVMPAALILQKQLIDWAVQKFHRGGHGVDRVVIYGAGEVGRRIASALLVSPRCALLPVAVVDENSRFTETCGLEMAYRDGPGITIHRVAITANLLQRFRCDLLVIATNLSEEGLRGVRAVARQASVRVALCAESPSAAGEVEENIELDGLRLVDEGTAAATWYYAYGKRVLDVCISSTLLILLSPIFLLIALLIKLTSAGPALFVQRRVGLDGALFKMYKFRSMSSRARPYECSPRNSRDQRITAIGRFLRRTSLDELPQLFNVFLGQMSLVGPRPEMPFIVRKYKEQQQRRLEVIPGITGLWQLSKDRAYPIHENLHYDFFYIRRRTLSLDLAILVHTLFFAMRSGI